MSRRTALGRLQSAVEQFAREERRRALERLPEAVKTALLIHMEWVRSTGESSKCLTDLKTQKKRDLQRSSRRVTVHRKRGGWVARLTLLPYLAIATRCTQTPQQAMVMLKVLQRAKELSSEIELMPEVQAVYQALGDACTEHKMSLSDLSPSFSTSVGAESLVGCSISGKYSTSLEDVLHQRHLLLEARSQGWPQLRAASLQVMQASVHCRPKVFGRACPQALKPQEAEDLAKLLDEKRRALCAKRQEKAFKDAVKLVEAVLQREEARNSSKRRDLQSNEISRAQNENGRGMRKICRLPA